MNDQLENLTFIATVCGLAGLVLLAAVLVLAYLALFMPRGDDTDPDTDGQNRSDHPAGRPEPQEWDYR